MIKKIKPRYRVLIQPGLTLSRPDQIVLTEKLRECARQCFDEVPMYQALSGREEELKRVVIALAEDHQGTVLGFSSAVLLDMPTLTHHGIPRVLHLGLTCVRPEARRFHLTHELSSRLIARYLLKKSLFKRVWISNVACVLSSLGNVALHFEDIFPSPEQKAGPSPFHQLIANTIEKRHREPLAIQSDSRFNFQKFVFEKSVKGSVFQKSETDRRYHHRDLILNQYYLDLMNFEEGDEVLQIGSVSLFSFPKYILKGMKKRLLRPISQRRPILTKS